MNGQMLRFVLREIFEEAAVWRSFERGNARSLEAANIFRRLIATADRIDDGVLLVYSELWESEDDRQAHARLVRDVGYRFRPRSASEFVARFIASRTSTAS